ncbi:tyrosine-type recombinase/integrase [Sulfurimonas sp.]
MRLALKDKKKPIVLESHPYEYYAVKFLDKKKFNVSDGTIKKYQRINTELCAKFGKLPISSLKVSTISDFIYSLGHTGKTLKDYITILNGTFQQALYDEAIVRNPINHIERPKAKRTEIKPFTKGEIEKLLNKSDGWIRNYIALAVYTGMRSGEIVGLKWKDVDFQNGFIDIKRSRHHGVDGSTKTSSSTRRIVIFDSLMPYMKNQHKLTSKLKAYVFMPYDNRPMQDSGQFNRVAWKNLLKDCNIEYRRVYNLRHTFATMMLQSGKFSVNMISDMLGHNSVQMLFNVYAKYIKGESENINRKIDIL